MTELLNIWLTKEELETITNKGSAVVEHSVDCDCCGNCTKIQIQVNRAVEP